MSQRFRTVLSLTLIAAAAVLASPSPMATAHEDHDHPGVFISPAELSELKSSHTVGEDLIIIDARSGNDYATAHIPGAINLQPTDLRTPKAKPGEGFSQYLFRVGDDYGHGDLDVQRYAAILGGAGLDAGDTVVVYGNHAGKADGSIPAMILDMLGHEGGIHFLDGLGIQRWQAAGFETTATPTVLPATDYQPSPRADVVWNLDDVQRHLGDNAVVFYDTRSLPEFTGENVRSNKRGGHIPGAVRIDYADLMDADKVTLAAEAIAQAHSEAGITPDKTVVLYCQTSTRVSLPYLALRQLGYANLVVYDASMHEYLNRSDTEIATGE
ncbi:MAG: rhodanese-like domain-containing protein [Planctomycetota bacterium]